MDPQSSLLFVLTGTVALSLTSVAIAFYIIFSVRRDVAAKERELRLTQEKQNLEFRLQQVSRMAIIGALAGGMAYYLNSILFAIGSLMEMMQYDQGTKKSMTQLSKLAANEITRGLTVTEQLQQLAHPHKLALRPLSITELMASIVDNLKHRFQESIKIETNFSQDENIVLGDQTLLRQVLVSLVTNAAEAMPDGGVITINVSKTDESEGMGTEIVDETKRDLIICVSDTGCGMDEETKRRVFEPFFTTKMQPERLGLGLSFAYGIANIHNGRILVESEEDQGTTVSIYLPIPSQDQLEYYEKQEQCEEDLILEPLSPEERMLIIKQKIGRA